MSVVVTVFALDQLSKAWARAVLDAPVSVAPFFDLRLGQNRGVAFGMFATDDPRGPVLVTILTAIIIGFVFSWLWRERHMMMAGPLALIGGGALGNLFDRFRDGAATDFLDFHVAGWHWPAFNVADVAIVSGVAVILLGSIHGSGLDQKPPQNGAA